MISASKWVKVGVANNPKRRRGEIQVGLPMKATLVTSVRFMNYDHALAAERGVHSVLDSAWSRGEWFKTSPDIAVAALRDLLTSFFDDRDGVHSLRRGDVWSFPSHRHWH